MTIERSRNLALLCELYEELMKDEPTDSPKTKEQINACMAGLLTAGDQAYIFKQDGIVIGYALIIFDKNPLYLRHFYICRDHRRKGRGTAAFHLLLDTLAVPVLDLDVYDWNERAKAFWTSLGFSPRTIVMRYQKKC